eukprot:TRINITY_DN7895_c2_g1_i1.p1 TRINITY_DN7895_c2_g1~~TRINITY_DN7895_c2_g1_i1.p1  ORF type:complete len:984 (-),score=310.35 TRINITY_DN7895_c2_g1_i1:104-3055(-)
MDGLNNEKSLINNNENNKIPKNDFEELKEFKYDMKSILKKIQKFIITGDEFGEAMSSLSDTIILLTKKNWCQEENLVLLMNQYGQTLRRITTLQKEMMNQVETAFNVPIFNYLEHDFHELKEMKNKKDKMESEFTKLSNKKPNSDISTVAAIGKELGRVKTNLFEVNESFEEALEALNSKKTLKFAKVLKETIHSQDDFYFNTNKTMSELNPFVKKMEQGLHEENEEDAKLYMEGFLRKLRDPMKATRNDFRRAWVVLKPGYLHTYKGKEAKIKSRSINLLISTVRACGNKIDNKHKKNLFLFEVISPGTKKIVLGCKTEEERAHWIKAISDIISNSLDQQVLSSPEVNEKTNKVTSQLENDEVFIKLQSVPGNKFCADCNSKDPKWASSNLGVLICVDCSGVHRSLGTHISRVRSTMLDQWSTDLLLYMEKIGNQRSNEWFERNLRDFEKPVPESDRNARELFITTKYKDLHFIEENLGTTPQQATDLLLEFCSRETNTKSKIPLLSHNMFKPLSASELLNKYYNERKSINILGDSGGVETDEEDEDPHEKPNLNKNSKSKMLRKTSEMSGSTHKLSMFKKIVKDKLEKNSENDCSDSDHKNTSTSQNSLVISHELDNDGKTDNNVKIKRNHLTVDYENNGNTDNETSDKEKKHSGDFIDLSHNEIDISIPDNEFLEEEEDNDNTDNEEMKTLFNNSVIIVENHNNNNNNNDINNHQNTLSTNNGLGNGSVISDTYFVVSLIRQGADPNYQDPVSLKSSLHKACINDKQELLFALIINGGDMSKQDILGWTPLHYIAANSSPKNQCTHMLARSTGHIQKNYFEIKDFHGRDSLLVATKQNNQSFINICKSFQKKEFPKKEDTTIENKDISLSQTLKIETNQKKTFFKKDKHRSVLFTSRHSKTDQRTSVFNNNNNKKGGSIRTKKELDNHETENEKLSRDIAALDINLNIPSPFRTGSDDEIDDPNKDDKGNKRPGFWKKKN